MSKLIYSLRRTLFSQPLGMTVRILKHKLSRKPATQAAPPPGILPIDILYGLDTSGRISASVLRTGSSADIHSYGYGASLPSIIRKAIETCPNLDQASFVDLGCGKGLPLAVATEYPFRRILGVELSPALCVTARENARRMAERFPERTRIEVVEGDMIAAELPSGYLVAYMYNPAYPPLISRLAKRLAEHQARGNKVMVIYYNPAGAKFFDRAEGFERYFAEHVPFEPEEIAATQLGNVADSVVIWQSAADPHFAPQPAADRPVDLVAGGAAAKVRMEAAA